MKYYKTAIRLAIAASTLKNPQQIEARARSWNNPVIWDVKIKGRAKNNVLIENDFVVYVLQERAELKTTMHLKLLMIVDSLYTHKGKILRLKEWGAETNEHPMNYWFEDESGNEVELFSHDLPDLQPYDDDGRYELGCV